MISLIVPFVRQYNQNACGAAALEMVYLYLGVQDINQEKIFNTYKKLEPHQSGNYYITTNDLVIDARKRGFISNLYRIDHSKIENLSALEEILKQNIPVVVCQKYTEELPLLGHFRVVTGFDQDFIYFHDPDPIHGGENMKWSHEKFLDFWQPTGQNVTGGIFFIILKN